MGDIFFMVFLEQTDTEVLGNKSAIFSRANTFQKEGTISGVLVQLQFFRSKNFRSWSVLLTFTTSIADFSLH